MYSVLIVDDEEPVLESYTYLIDTALDDFTVCATARSGGDAIAAARQHRPDLVLMDIAMPGIDGLDTIRELQHEFSETLYILSTAYERFDLAKRAIPLRVFAYLVKPVSRKRFMETMFRAKDELDDARARLSRRLEDARHGGESIAREIQGFMSLITWKSLEEDTWNRYRNLFELNSDYGVVAAVRSPRREWYAEIAEQLERRYRCFWTEDARRMLVLVTESVSPEAVERSLREIAETFPATSESIALGVGSRRRYDEFSRSSDEALLAIPPAAGMERHLLQFRRCARDFAATVARARTVEPVYDAYQRVSDETNATWRFPVARFRIASLIEGLLQRVDAESGDPDISVSIADPIDDVFSMDTRREVDAWARRVLRLIVEARTRFDGKHLPETLRVALRFVDEHYAEPLQLSSVAEHCGVSTGHLSRLFSEHAESSFSDYLNSVRIGVAQRLLAAESQTIKEIAYAVGYQDPNYFSRIFKKVVGRSPREYADHAIGSQ